MADTTIPVKVLTTFFDAVNKGNFRVEKRFHGDSPQRQPVHTREHGRGKR
jgi:hypothetical protein